MGLGIKKFFVEQLGKTGALYRLVWLDIFLCKEKCPPLQKEVLVQLLKGNYEEAVGLYSVQVSQANNFLLSPSIIRKIFTQSAIRKHVSKVKSRYYEFILSLLDQETREEYEKKVFYEGFEREIIKLRSILAFEKLAPNETFFENRIKEWLQLFETKKVPYVTKNSLFEDLKKFNLDQDESLFRALVHVTPFYFLRKMQLPDLEKFRRLSFVMKDDLEDMEKLNVLDYGCGTADLSLFLAQKGHNVTICDVKGGNLDYAKKRFQLRSLPITTVGATAQQPIPAIEAKFDLIIALEVLEHVREPLQLLEMFNRIIVDGGKILLGSFPFNPTQVGGDHLEESVSRKEELLNWINTKWKRLGEDKVIGNTFIKRS